MLQPVVQYLILAESILSIIIRHISSPTLIIHNKYRITRQIYKLRYNQNTNKIYLIRQFRTKIKHPRKRKMTVL